MDHDEVGKLWNENAESWEKASKNGLDIWRDYVNTPAFLQMLPNVKDLAGLDIGCGEGYNSRLIAKRCHFLTAIDIADQFLATNLQSNNPHNISFHKINATQLPFANDYFDFAVAVMSLMDIPELDKVLTEIYRVLAPNGFFQFSIVHPCFDEHKGKWCNNDQKPAFLMQDYFRESHGEVHEWQHPRSPKEMPKFRVPRFSKPLNLWFDLLLKTGFILEEVREPYADDEAIAKYPELQTTRIVAHTLMIRVRKAENKTTLHKIIEKLPGNVWWKDKNLVYLGCNDRVINILGLNSRNDFVGKTDHDLWDQSIADKLKDADTYVLQTEETLNLEETIVQKDGSEAVMLTNKSPLYDVNNNIIGIVGTSTDITERKKMEAHLHYAKEKAEHADKLKTDFIHNMEHDIRTPFNGVLGIAEYLYEKVQEPEVKELLYDIALCAKELLEYCNVILDFSKLEEGLYPVLAKKFDLAKLIESIFLLETPAAKIKNLIFTTQVDANIPSCLIGDPSRLQRILLNLVGNAIKFTSTGNITLKIKLAKVENKMAILNFIITDTGIGIPNHIQTLIYEKFVRGTPSNQGLYKGFGLGLHVVKQLIEEVEGEIEVESEEGKGTQFLCTIPFKIPLVEQVRQIHVLLIEPNAELLSAQISLLNEKKWEITNVQTGKQAQELIVHKDFDFIFMAAMLPDINVIDGIKFIHKFKPQTPIIILASIQEKNLEDDLMLAGANEFMAKPISVERCDFLAKKYLSI